MAQIRAGERGGLSLDATLDLRHVLYMDNTVMDGFIVHVAHKVSALGSPIVVAAGMHVHIRVELVRRHLRNRCLEKPPLVDYTYDPDGISCFDHYFQNSISKYANCEIPIFGYAPNASLVCRPQHIQVLSTLLTGDLVDKALQVDYH